MTAAVAFVWHERRSASPMLDLGLFSNGTVRGAAIAQTGTAIAMASVMFVAARRHVEHRTDLVTSFFHGERITYGVLAVLVGLIAGGALALTDSDATEKPEPA